MDAGPGFNVDENGSHSEASVGVSTPGASASAFRSQALD